MEKSGEKSAWDFCWDALLARQNNNKLQGEFAEQTHEYNEVVRMVFRKSEKKRKVLGRFTEQTHE